MQHFGILIDVHLGAQSDYSPAKLKRAIELFLEGMQTGEETFTVGALTTSQLPPRLLRTIARRST